MKPTLHFALVLFAVSLLASHVVQLRTMTKQEAVNQDLQKQISRLGLEVAACKFAIAELQKKDDPPGR